MRLIVDTNIIISALIKDSVTRRIMLHPLITVFTLDYALVEIENYKKIILKKSKLSDDKFESLLRVLSSKMVIVPFNKTIKYFPKAERMIEDKEDIPFIALSLLVKNEGIWTEDKHFKDLKEIKIWTTKELMERVL